VIVNNRQASVAVVPVGLYKGVNDIKTSFTPTLNEIKTSFSVAVYGALLALLHSAFGGKAENAIVKSKPP
jgi:hypothetical protein